MTIFRMALLAATLALGAVVAVAQDAREPAVRATIQAQLDAFEADDWARAFAYASPAIRGMFGTPERFGQMVRQGYPMVWRPRRAEFGPLRDTQDGLVQTMIYEDAAGRIYYADYFMVEVDGQWRINGVILREPDQLGA